MSQTALPTTPQTTPQTTLRITRQARALAVAVTVLAVLGLSASGVSLAAVDVNHANAQELQQVRGIGAKTAKRIVVERARGPFESLEHLSERLSGIGPKTVIKLKAAGLCAGTVDKPCAAPQTVSRASASGVPVRRGQPVDISVVTPEILRLQ